MQCAEYRTGNVLSGKAAESGIIATSLLLPAARVATEPLLTIASMRGREFALKSSDAENASSDSAAWTPEETFSPLDSDFDAELPATAALSAWINVPPTGSFELDPDPSCSALSQFTPAGH